METEDLIKQWDRNFKELERMDKTAKKCGRLVGRYISEPIADGKAFYIITKEMKTKVRIKHCKNVGDDYIIPYWGESAIIDKQYAKQNIERRDHLAELFT